MKKNRYFILEFSYHVVECQFSHCYFLLGCLGYNCLWFSLWSSCFGHYLFLHFGCLFRRVLFYFGSALGLRQMLLSKFLIGDYATRLFAAINVVACVGWGAVNIMSSAQLLHIVNNGALPPWAGCLILVVCTVLVTFFGYHVIHIYEKWSWIPNLIIFIIIIVRFAMTGKFNSADFVGGRTTAGSVLSFGGTVFGFATGWSTYAADYVVYHPRNTNPYKVFSVSFGFVASFVVYFDFGCRLCHWYCQ